MTTTMLDAARQTARLSVMSQGLLQSEILKIAAEVRAMIAEGHEVANLTVGDFKPAEFPVPASLMEGIAAALKAGETNYPPSDGMPQLRQAIARFTERRLGLATEPKNVLVASGARPILYAIYRTLCDPGDRVLYPVPSWNNNHYCHLVAATPVPVQSRREDDFLPTRDTLADTVQGARLLVLNSPCNPTGTVFSAEQLGGICDLILEENARRESAGERPLYLLYDQVYWMLTLDGARHVTPLELRPELAPYTVLVDGISKALAATGLRVGWGIGPTDVIAAMSDLVGHVGAWAPRPEQVATAKFLDDDAAIDTHCARMNADVAARCAILHDALVRMRDAGLPCDVVKPRGAIYVSASFPLDGRTPPDGPTIRGDDEARAYLLRAAGMAIVPFRAFGALTDTGWFRLSVGAITVDECERLVPRLESALRAVSS